MQVFGSDAVIGSYRLSGHGLMLSSFSANDNSSSLGLDMETVEQRVGANPVPVYLGSRPKGKLELEFSIIKKACNAPNASIYFTESECRDVLRNLTGYAGYKWMSIGEYTEENPDPYALYRYNVRILKAEYQKANGKVIGINFEGECDSPFAWEYRTTTDATTANKSLNFNNDSDDINNYLLPKTSIISRGGNISITNTTEGRETVLKNTQEYDTIVMDSNRCTILINSKPLSNLQDFNHKFLRFVPGVNDLIVTGAYQISYEYRFARKVGFLS